MGVTNDNKKQEFSKKKKKKKKKKKQETRTKILTLKLVGKTMITWRSWWIKRFHSSWSSWNFGQGKREFDAWYDLSWEGGLFLYCIFLPSSLQTFVVGSWYWQLSFDPSWKIKLCQMCLAMCEKERKKVVVEHISQNLLQYIYT